MTSKKKLKLIIVAIISVVCLFGTVYFSYMNQLNKGLYDNYDTIVDDAVYIINEDDTSIYSKEQLSYVADNNITAAYYQKKFYIIDEASKCNVWVINKECKKYGIPTNFNIFISIEHIDLIPNKVYMSYSCMERL